MLKLADRLRGLRGTESQTAFAARFGLKQAIYSHYETGRKKPSLEVLVDMAVKLGATTDYLLGLSDTPPSVTVPTVQAGDNSQVAIGNNAPVIIAKRNVTINSGNMTVESEKEIARRKRALGKFKFK